MNPCHNHFIPKSASRCQNRTVTDLQTCAERLRGTSEKVTSFSSVNSQSLVKSRHRVWCAEWSIFSPSGERFVLCKVSFCIASVWDRPRQNLHAHTHSFKKLPMGCISDRCLIVADLSKWCLKEFWTERSFPCLFLFKEPNCVHNWANRSFYKGAAVSTVAFYKKTCGLLTVETDKCTNRLH